MREERPENVVSGALSDYTPGNQIVWGLGEEIKIEGWGTPARSELSLCSHRPSDPVQLCAIFPACSETPPGPYSMLPGG